MGSNEQNMFPLVQGLEEEFYIFSIRGPISQAPGYAFFTIEGYGKPHRDVFKQAVSQLTKFIEYAIKTISIDQSKLYLLGFSQGAILSMSLALTLGNKIKGIVALSGYIPKIVMEDYEIQPVKHLSVFISHGEMDRSFAISMGYRGTRVFQKITMQM